MDFLMAVFEHEDNDNMLRQLLILSLVVLLALPLAAQENTSLNLPTDLYVLLNDGLVQRFSPGSASVTTISPEGVFVLDFGVSLDGSQIAYRTDSGTLMLMDTADPASARQVDDAADVPTVRGRGDTVAWSPGGDAIAYTTLTGARVYLTDGAFATIEQQRIIALQWSPNGQYLLCESDGNIWWIYRRDPGAMTLVAALPSSIGTTWVSGSELVFAPGDGGLILMNLAQGNAQTLLLDAVNEYRLPQLTRDGRLLLFRRPKGDALIPEGHGQLVVLSPGVAQPQELSGIAIDLTGRLRWAPGAEVMLTFEGGVLALYNPVDGTAVALPANNAVAYSWGTYPPVIGSEAPTSAPDTTAEAVFPDEFPTLDPAQPIPGVTPMIDPNATPQPGTAG
jgi:hypothetical protein